MKIPWPWLGSLILILANGSPAAEEFPGETWPRKTPEEAGLVAARLEAFKNEVGGHGCVTRDGAIVLTWGEYDKPHDVASALKPLYSFLLLKAIEEGRLSGPDHKVIEFQPCLRELNADLSFKDRGMTFRHLAFQTACLGYREPPGTAFDYNDRTMGFFWDTLINLVYEVSWQEAESRVIAPRLTRPLGFEDGIPGVKRKDKTGRFAVSPRDFCRFGLLFLREGQWDGEHVLRADLARMAVDDPLPLAIPRTEGVEAESCDARSIGGGGNQTDHNGGYSWMWWLNRTARDGRLWFPDVPEDFYACFGHGGQEGMAVLPTQRIIVSWIGRRVHEDRERGNRAFGALAAAGR